MAVTIDLCVADCMTRSVVSVSSNTDLTKPIGIIATTDIVRAVADARQASRSRTGNSA